MIGGMATATLLTLLVIPAIFVIWKRLGLGRLNREIEGPRLLTNPLPGE